MHKRVQSGFTLVEVMVSLLVASLLLGAVYSIVVGSTSINAKTTLRSEAGSLAFKKVQDYINLDFGNVPIGDAVAEYLVEDFSAEAEGLKLRNAEAKIFIEPESTLDAATTTVTTDYSQTVQADATFIGGSEISSVNTHDAAGIHHRHYRIRDDSFSNYTYNRYGPGADNKPLPSIDLGSAVVVDTIRIEWWTCSYGANDFRIEAKNNSPNSNSGWTTIVSGLSDNGIPCSSSASAAQDVDVSSNTVPYRYWRMYMVDATHSTWNVLSEFEAFSSGVPGDIVEQQGANATDSPGSLFFSSSDLEMSNDGSKGDQSVGLIFDDIDTPQGATVTDAYIEFTADESDSAAVTLMVTGVDRDNAQPWAGGFAVDNAVDADNSDGSVGTSATVTWIPAPWSSGENGADTRVNVTDIVQELVDRTGWSVDNDMAFAIQHVSGSGQRVGERNPAPELVIDWSESVTTTTGVYVDDDDDGDVDNPTLLRITSMISYDAFGDRHDVVYTTFIRKFGIGQ